MAAARPPERRRGLRSTISSRRAEVEFLPENEAHVWLARPEEVREPSLLEGYLALLGSQERERHGRLRRKQEPWPRYAPDSSR